MSKSKHDDGESYICDCPLCRFADGELTPSEVAWYIKGRIEKQYWLFKLIKESTNLDELKKEVSFREVDLDGDYDFLADLKNNKERNPEGWWDKAMDKPENMVLTVAED